MTDHKSNAAGRKPFDTFRNQKNIPDPAENQSENDGGRRGAGGHNIKTEQGQQNKGFGDVSHPAVFSERRSQMNDG